MFLRAFGFVCVIVVCGVAPSFGQQRQTGPRTLEGLLNSDEAQKPAAAAAPVADATDSGPKRPAGTVARPKDGVKHPDLDKAWADYDAAVTKAAEGIRAAINKQFDAATAKGDLDAAEKWQAAIEKFEKAVELPTEKEAKAAVSAATADFKKAREELAAAYEAVVKALTMEKKIAAAKIARSEAVEISAVTLAQVALPKAKPANANNFDVFVLPDLQQSVVPGCGHKEYQNGRLREAWGDERGAWIDLTKVNGTLQSSVVPGRGHIEYQNGRLREAWDDERGAWIKVKGD